MGGPSEFVLRLPNLMAYVVYLFFSFRILDRFAKDKIIAISGFFLLNLKVVSYVLLGVGGERRGKVLAIYVFPEKKDDK
jgi:hypothetical protein